MSIYAHAYYICIYVDMLIVVAGIGNEVVAPKASDSSRCLMFLLPLAPRITSKPYKPWEQEAWNCRPPHSNRPATEDA